MTKTGGKRRSVLEPESFARHLGLYLWHLVEDAGGDRSGRWLSGKLDRSKGYCEKLLNQSQAMTTNDIALVSVVFEVSPYEFVRAARDWDSGGDRGDWTAPPAPVVPISSGVGRSRKDLERAALDSTKVAASRDNTPVDPARGEK